VWLVERAVPGCIAQARADVVERKKVPFAYSIARSPRRFESRALCALPGRKAANCGIF
jgi:hypothetical protein